MTHLHFPVIPKPKWFKAINRSRILKFLYEAYLGIQEDSVEQRKRTKNDKLPGVGERL